MVSSHPDPRNPTTTSGSDTLSGNVGVADADELEPVAIRERDAGEPAGATGGPNSGRPSGGGDRTWATLVTVLNHRPATSRGWWLLAAGIGGTLLVAVSYLASWLTAALEHRDGVDVDAMALHEVTTTPLVWMYRIATLGMIGCAVALLYVPHTAARPLRIVGFSAAGLSLYSALVATLVITNVSGALNGAMTVRYGLGLYAAYLGIAALTSFIGLFDRPGGDRPAVTQ